jgi:hypothetical protein
MDFFTTEPTEITERRETDTLTGEIIGAAIEVHRLKYQSPFSL